MTNGRLIWIPAALCVTACAAPLGQTAEAGPTGFVGRERLSGRAEALAQDAMWRIERTDGQLHSVLAMDPTLFDQARRVDARAMAGQLAGKPILIKDNIEVAGPLPTTAGSLALINNVTNRDAPLVARLRAAGMVIVGKAN